MANLSIIAAQPFPPWSLQSTSISQLVSLHVPWQNIRLFGQRDLGRAAETYVPQRHPATWHDGRSSANCTCGLHSYA